MKYKLKELNVPKNIYSMYRQKNYTKCLKVPKTPKNSLKRAESTKNLQKEAKTDQSMDKLTYFFYFRKHESSQHRKHINSVPYGEYSYRIHEQH